MEQRSLVQAKAFGATHASVSQVDNAKGLSEVQPSIGANRPVAVGPAAVASFTPLPQFTMVSMPHLPMLCMLPQLLPMPSMPQFTMPSMLLQLWLMLSMLLQLWLMLSMLPQLLPTPPLPIMHQLLPHQLIMHLLRLMPMKFLHTPTPTLLLMTTQRPPSMLRRPLMVPAMSRDLTELLFQMTESKL